MVTVAAMPAMSPVPAVSCLVLVSGMARVLEMCDGLTLVDGCVTGMARAVRQPVLVALALVGVLGRGSVLGMFRRGAVGRVRR